MTTQISNLNELYNKLLPEFCRREDEREEINYFLKRFLTWFGDELDRVDEIFDTFHLKIRPETAPEQFVEWWLWAIFGWSWFPTWFSLEQKRTFYRDIAHHYAQRGTKRGITEFLAVFGIKAIVHNGPVYCGEAVCGEEVWMIDEPLGIVVTILPEIEGLPGDVSYCEEAFCGEGFAVDAPNRLDRPDVEALLRFQAPFGQILMIEERTAD